MKHEQRRRRIQRSDIGWPRHDRNHAHPASLDGREGGGAGRAEPPSGTVHRIAGRCVKRIVLWCDRGVVIMVTLMRMSGLCIRDVVDVERKHAEMPNRRDGQYDNQEPGHTKRRTHHVQASWRPAGLSR